MCVCVCVCVCGGSVLGGCVCGCVRHDIDDIIIYVVHIESGYI